MKTIHARKRGNNTITDEVKALAIKRGSLRAESEPYATAVRYLAERNSIELDFVDSTAVMLPIVNYPELSQLSEHDLQQLTLKFGGSILCLNHRDLHISITGLVAASTSLTELATAVVQIENIGNTGEMISHRRQSALNAFSQIDLHNPWEFQHLTRELGVSDEELLGALERAAEKIRLTRDHSEEDDMEGRYRPA